MAPSLTCLVSRLGGLGGFLVPWQSGLPEPAFQQTQRRVDVSEALGMAIDTESLLSYLISQRSHVAYPDPKGRDIAPSSSWKECVAIFHPLHMVPISKESS